MSTQKPTRAAGEVAARVAGRASSDVLPVADIGGAPDGSPWTLEQVLNPAGNTCGLVVVRWITAWECRVDRAFYQHEHTSGPGHEGWFVSPAKIVTCAGTTKVPCGTPLFPLIRVTGDPRDMPPMLDEPPPDEADAA